MLNPIGIKFVVPGEVCVRIAPDVPPTILLALPTITADKVVNPVPPYKGSSGVPNSSSSIVALFIVAFVINALSVTLSVCLSIPSIALIKF